MWRSDGAMKGVVGDGAMKDVVDDGAMKGEASEER